MNIIIEQALIKDAEILNNLFTFLLEDDRINYDNNIKENLNIKDFFEKRIDLKESIILVAKSKETIIGYIYGYIRYDNKIKKELEVNIDSIYVLKEYRNKKVGTKLIEEFISFSKKKKVKYIFIDNKFNNKIANHLYSKMGFNNFITTKRKII